MFCFAGFNRLHAAVLYLVLFGAMGGLNPRLVDVFHTQTQIHILALASGHYAVTGQTRIKTGMECSGGLEEDLGLQLSVDACRTACTAKKGAACKYFSFGTGVKAGNCWWEEKCDTFITNDYDAYRLNSGMWNNQLSLNYLPI